jgi:hypothetical protein
VVAIIAGPVLAMFIAHVFAAILAEHSALGRSLTKSELLDAVRAEWGFLLLAAPPLALLLILNVTGVALDDSIRVIIWFSAASLGLWAGLAGLRAGLRGSKLALAVIIGLLVGGAVLTLQVFLQPGKAVSNGVAAISLDA